MYGRTNNGLKLGNFNETTFVRPFGDVYCRIPVIQIFLSQLLSLGATIKYVWKWWPSEAYYEEAISPAGRVHCSIEDWAKFISLQLTEENSILDKEYLNKLIEPVGSHFYAAGWGVAEYAWAKGITLNHAGSNEIWYAVVLITPKVDRAFVVATNSRDLVLQPICVGI